MLLNQALTIITKATTATDRSDNAGYQESSSLTLHELAHQDSMKLNRFFATFLQSVSTALQFDDSSHKTDTPVAVLIKTTVMEPRQDLTAVERHPDLQEAPRPDPTVAGRRQDLTAAERHPGLQEAPRPDPAVAGRRQGLQGEFHPGHPRNHLADRATSYRPDNF